MLRARRFLSMLALAALGACSKGSGDVPTAASGRGATVRPPVTAPPRAKSANEEVAIDFLSPSSDCTFGHRGVLIDLGDATSASRLSGSRLVEPDLQLREHEGASWAAVRSRSLTATFVSSSEQSGEGGVVVAARARGGSAKSMTAYLNGKLLGTLGLAKGETKLTSARGPGAIARGTNELLLRFNGGARNTREELAELDWIRVGPFDGDAPYSAPTRIDALSTLSIGGTAHRSVSLRAPGFARCSAFLSSGSVLEGFVGVTGGEAEAEVRVLIDRAEPRVVGSFHLGGPTDPPGWRPISLPLGDLGTIAGVELVAKSSTKGARVAFAEARVTSPVAARAESAVVGSAPAARGVVLVVLGSTSRRISLYGGPVPMPELEGLARGGTVFEGHRASSSFASAAMGSMLTGLSPREHGASDDDAMLSPSVFTVAEAARQAGIVTGMFTANPTTSAGFGFARGWETFSPQFPTVDKPGLAVFEQASAWLEQHKSERFLLVVHARGGHPPWEATSEELKELPPQGYQGSLEPKAAGEALAKAKKTANRTLSDADRERAFALHAKAVAAHDRALGGLITALRAIGRDKDTAWIVTGDVGIDSAAKIPFLEEDVLEEGALALPLVVRGTTAATRDRVRVQTSELDIARTLLDAFGLPPPAELRGASLWSFGKPGPSERERPLFAMTTTRFSVRLGPFALMGTREREAKFCNFALDGDCSADVRAAHPLAAELLHGLAWCEFADRKGRVPSENAGSPKPSIDGPTAAALKVWGR